LSGIAAARFYLDVHPDKRVLILEKEDSVGGPWGRSRIYPGFWSQSGIRMSGFSDVPLTVPQNAEVFNDIFEAKYVTDYLERYLDNHIYSDVPLRDRVVTEFAVSKVDKVRDIWTVQGALTTDGIEQLFKTKRIIVATGMTSAPRMPKFDGQEQFGGPILHQVHYGQFLSEQPSDHRKVAVLGAGKSAADMVYGLVKAGNEVHWIIRKSGKGPGAFTNPAENAKGPFLNDPELAATRLFATMSPACFSQPSLWTRFLHNTSMGERILKGVWNGADEKCKRIGNFHGREGALQGFDQLESDVK
jgi:dimethylaniline monooxygenase (N-oxide forming)